MKGISSVLCAFLGLCLASQTATADDNERGLEAALKKAGEEFCLANMDEMQRFSKYYEPDWTTYYKHLGCRTYRPSTCFYDSKSGGQWITERLPGPIFWAGPTNSDLNGPPANLSSGMLIMPH